MKKRYSVLWTDHALSELSETVSYLRENFSAKEIHRLGKNIETILSFVSLHPRAFPASEQQPSVRRAVVARFNTLYYRIDEDKKQIEILSFFPNRKEPK